MTALEAQLNTEGAQLDSAFDDLSNGHLSSAIGKGKAFLQSYPRSYLRGRAYLLIGDAELRRNRPVAAMAWLEKEGADLGQNLVLLRLARACLKTLAPEERGLYLDILTDKELPECRPFLPSPNTEDGVLAGWYFLAGHSTTDFGGKMFYFDQALRYAPNNPIVHISKSDAYGFTGNL